MRARPFQTGKQDHTPRKQTGTSVERPSTVIAGPIEKYIRKGGPPPKLDGLGNVKDCPNC